MTFFRLRKMLVQKKAWRVDSEREKERKVAKRYVRVMIMTKINLR